MYKKYICQIVKVPHIPAILPPHLHLGTLLVSNLNHLSSAYSPLHQPWWFMPTWPLSEPFSLFSSFTDLHNAAQLGSIHIWSKLLKRASVVGTCGFAQLTCNEPYPWWSGWEFWEKTDIAIGRVHAEGAVSICYYREWFTVALVRLVWNGTKHKPMLDIRAALVLGEFDWVGLCSLKGSRRSLIWMYTVPSICLSLSGLGTACPQILNGRNSKE